MASGIFESTSKENEVVTRFDSFCARCPTAVLCLRISPKGRSVLEIYIPRLIVERNPNKPHSELHVCCSQSTLTRSHHPARVSARLMFDLYRKLDVHWHWRPRGDHTHVMRLSNQ